MAPVKPLPPIPTKLSERDEVKGRDADDTAYQELRILHAQLQEYVRSTCQ